MPPDSISEIKKEPNNIIVKPKIKNKNVNKMRQSGNSNDNLEKELQKLRTELKNMKSNVSGIFIKNDAEISRKLEEQQRKKNFDQREYLRRNINSEI